MENGNSNQQNQFPGQTVIVNQIENRSNGAGTAGFILAILALFAGWIPVAGWLVWLMGLIFSLIGATRKPKGLAVAGLIISLIGVIMLIMVFGAIGSALLFSK